MGLFFYNLSIAVYGLIIRLVSPFNEKAAKFLAGRRSWQSRLRQDIGEPRPRFWMHCASLGEFEQGRPVIEALKELYPSYSILITFFSPSGYEVRKDYAVADHVCYLPLDTHKNAIQFLEITSPTAAIFIKYEVWYHYFHQMSKRKVPFFLVSAIFRDDHIYFKRYGAFNTKILRNITHIFTQDDRSRDLLAGSGITNVTVSGDTRFDRVVEISSRAQDDMTVSSFASGHRVFVIGSSWAEDHVVLIPFIKKHLGELKFIIAPHEILESQIQRLCDEFDGHAVRYTHCTNNYAGDHRVMVVDTIGILSRIYKYGHFAYIGGAFGAGLHNILEAATFGMPIFFGDKTYWNFREARDLLKIEGAFTVSDMDELTEKFQSLKAEPIRMSIGKQNADYVTSNTGATASIVEHIRQWIK